MNKIKTACCQKLDLRHLEATHCLRLNAGFICLGRISVSTESYCSTIGLKNSKGSFTNSVLSPVVKNALGYIMHATGLTPGSYRLSLSMNSRNKVPSAAQAADMAARISQSLPIFLVEYS